MKTLYLVACAKLKLQGRHPAQELYCSDLFKKSRAYVASQLQAGDGWLILSAKHGVLYPDESVLSYDLAIKDLSDFERAAWAQSVWRDCLFDYFDPFGREGFRRLVFLAGARYQVPLRAAIAFSACASVVIEDPLQGLEIGQRLSWLKANTPQQARPA